MVLGESGDRLTQIRKLAGNLDEHDAPDDDVEQMMLNYDNWVEVKTQKFDWASTDDEWKQVLNASNFMTAAELLDGIPTDRAAKKAGEHRIAARDIIKAINNKDDDQPKLVIHGAGPNLTDELDPVNYIHKAGDTI